MVCGETLLGVDGILVHMVDFTGDLLFWIEDLGAGRMLEMFSVFMGSESFCSPTCKISGAANM